MAGAKQCNWIVAQAERVERSRFDPYEAFGGTEHLRAWEGAPEGWDTWIHNNAACIDEFQFQRRSDGLCLQSTRGGVALFFARKTTSRALIEDNDFLAVLEMAKKIHAWCKAQPREDWL